MSEMDGIRVLIADDHAVLRAGLRLLIDAQPDMQTVAEAGDSQETLTKTAAHQPDVLLLDLSMPGEGGLGVLGRVRTAVPETRVLVLTMHADEDYLRLALRLGASGYVVKAAADQELLAAIRAVARGEVYVHSSLLRPLLQDVTPAPAASPYDAWYSLSTREQQVIRDVSVGFTNREIATQLGLSVKTVETYRARAMEKLELSTRAELVEYAIRRGWMGER